MLDAAGREEVGSADRARAEAPNVECTPVGDGIDDPNAPEPVPEEREDHPDADGEEGQEESAAGEAVDKGSRIGDDLEDDDGASLDWHSRRA